MIFAGVIAFTAWLSDDAYITFRVVDNAVHGLGLTWNPAERVQAFTHPLWLFVLIIGRFASGEIYYSAIWLSIAISVVAFGVIAIHLRATPTITFLGLLVLLGSKAYVDYSTSGLENPLTHLLLAVFLIVWFNGTASSRPLNDRSLFLLFFLSALLALNRIDIILIVAPVLAYTFWRNRSVRTFKIAMLGFVPLILWLLFSFIYYGFPFPNTAYAKLATEIAPLSLARQGIVYFLNSLRWDPITLTVIMVALVIGITSRKARFLALTIGLALYLIYIVRIGGDFMSGRFFTAPLLVAIVLLIARGDEVYRHRLIHRKNGKSLSIIIAIAIILLGLAGWVRYWQAGSPIGDAAHRDNGITDERAYYAPHTGLFFSSRELHPWALQGVELRAQGPAVVEHGNVGFLGFYAGPAVHIVDRNGLTDPLLARLPVRDPAHWRIGHFRREVPPGYVDTIREGRNLIQDADLAAYYEPLHQVTSGPLWSATRLTKIWQLNGGVYDHLLPKVWPRP